MNAQKPREYGYPWKALVGLFVIGASALMFVASIITYLLNLPDFGLVFFFGGMVSGFFSLYLLLKAFGNWRKKTNIRPSPEAASTSVPAVAVGEEVEAVEEESRWTTSLMMQIMSLLPTKRPQFNVKLILTVVFWSVVVFVIINKWSASWAIALVSSFIAMVLSITSVKFVDNLQEPSGFVDLVMCVMVWVGTLFFVAILALPYVGYNATAGLLVAVAASLVIPQMRFHSIVLLIYSFGKGIYKGALSRVQKPKPVKPVRPPVALGQRLAEDEPVVDRDVATKPGPVIVVAPISAASSSPSVPASSHFADNLTEVLGNNLRAVYALTQAGILTFNQYANLDSKEAMKIFEEAGLFPEWNQVDSSQALAREKAGLPPLKTVAPTAPPTPPPARRQVVIDDLTVISGVGPKVDMALKKSRIFTIRELAEASPEKLLAALQKANPLYTAKKVISIKTAARKYLKNTDDQSDDLTVLGLSEDATAKLKAAGYTIVTLADSTAKMVQKRLAENGIKVSNLALCQRWVDAAFAHRFDD